VEQLEQQFIQDYFAADNRFGLCNSGNGQVRLFTYQATHTVKHYIFKSINGYDISGLNEDIVLWCGVYTSNNSINRLLQTGGLVIEWRCCGGPI
jgi:hypothetical protein